MLAIPMSAQDTLSASFGKMYIHSEGNFTVFGDHRFTKANTYPDGIIGSERKPSQGYFNFAPDATWQQADNSKFIDGYVRHFGNTGFLFPIGDNGKFRPCAVTSGSYVEACYFGVNPSIAITSDMKGGDYPVLPSSGPFASDQHENEIINVSQYEYWDINGTDPTIITLTWDADSRVDEITSNDLERLAIVGWNGSEWEYIPSFIDLNSVSLNTHTGDFEGPQSNVSKGSITTKVPIIPSDYEVYTLASTCIYMDLDVSEGLLICLGEEFTLNANSYDEAELVWNTGYVGNSFSDSPTETTLYSVTAILGSCEITSEILVEVVDQQVDLGQDTSVCSGTDITIEATDIENAFYEWEHRGIQTFGNNTITLENLNTPSTLYVTVTDENGCAANDSLFIDIRQSPDVFTGRDASICVGDSTFLQAFGSLDGTGYVWSTGDTTSLIWVQPTETDTFEVLLTQNGCTDVSFVLVEVYPQAYVEITNDEYVCFEDPIVLETFGTQGSYSWTTGETTASIIADPDSSLYYSVTLTSPGNCDWQDEINLKSFEDSVEITEETFICKGESAILSLSGVIDSVRWSTGSINSQITVQPDSTETYSATVYKGSCSFYIETTVNVESLLNVDLGDDLTICKGESVELSTNSAGQYMWNTGENTNTINASPLSTTNYQVTVSSGSCLDTDSITVIVLDDEALIDITTDSLFCEGSEVVINLNASSTDLIWSDGSTGESLSIFPVDGQSYSVTVTNTNGCTASDTIHFTSYQNGFVDLGPDQSICMGEEIQLDLQGNFESILWSNGSTNDYITVSPLSSTVYSVTTTLNGCESTDSMTVNVNQAIDADLRADTTICMNQSLELGFPNITGEFNWSTGQTGNTITVNPTSNSVYSVTISSGSCETTDEINVIIDSTSIEIIGNPNYCPGESHLLTSNATEGIITWNNGTVGDSIRVYPSQGFVYSATIVSPNGCQASDSISPQLFDIENLNLGPDKLVCAGSNQLLEVQGSYDSVVWSDGSTGNSLDFIATNNISYSVTVTEANCSISDTIFFEVAEELTVNLGPDINLCPGESIVLDAGNSGNILWSTGQTSSTITVTPTQSQSYSVTITEGQCSSSDTIMVSLESIPNLTIEGNEMICPGETLLLTAVSTAENFLWSTGDTSSTIELQPLGQEVYTLTVTNEYGCSNSEEIEIVLANPGVIDLGEDLLMCEGVSVELSVSDSFESVVWSNGATTHDIIFTPTSSSTVSVQAWKGNCVVSDTLNIEVDNSLSLDLGPDPTICIGLSVRLGTNILGEYLWSTGDTTRYIEVSPDISTSYTLQINSGQCVLSDEITVNIENQAYVNITSGNLFCEGEFITLTCEGSQGEYLWSNGMTGQSIQVFPINGSFYSVTVTTDSGCQSSDQITMTAVITSRSIFLGEDIYMCQGHEVALPLSTTYKRYNWEDGSRVNPRIVRPTTTTTYSVSATDGKCVSRDSITVHVSDEIDLDLGEDMTICENGIIQISSNYTGEYQWSTGEDTKFISVSPYESSMYKVTVSSGSCVAEDSVWVMVDDVFVDILNYPVFCDEDTFKLETVSSANTFKWSTGETSSAINVIPESNNSYTVTVTSDSGCVAKDRITLRSYDEGDVSLGPDMRICHDGSIELKVSGMYENVVWDDGFTGTVRTIQPDQTETYSITASYGSCIAYDEVTIFVEDDILLDLGPDLTICPGQTLSLGDNFTGGQYEWNTGETETEIMISPMQTTSYRVTVTSGNCIAEDEIIVNVTDDCMTDLYVRTSSDNFSPTPGEFIVLSVLVGNEGTLTATGIEIQESLRSGFSMVNSNLSMGYYDYNSGMWYVDELAPGETATLDITVEVMPGGELFNIVEIMHADQMDIDSEPGNGNELEDDFDKIDLQLRPINKQVHGLGEIGDLVWLDSNGNGYQDKNEEGLEGIKVSLYESSNKSVPVLITETNEEGKFLFEQLSQGHYFLEFTLPEGMAFSPDGFKDQNDLSFEDKDSDVKHAFGPGTSNIINLGRNEKMHTCDAGMYPMGSISAFVWKDAHGGLDGRYDPLIDSGVEDVVLHLYDIKTDELIAEKTTNSNGHIQFDALKAGQYYIELELPEHISHKGLVKQDAYQDEEDSDFNRESLRSSIIHVRAGENVDDIYAGLADSLPFKLLDFWPEHQPEDNIVQLFWATESENNTDYFVIEKSDSLNADFETLDELVAFGDIESVNYYSYDDFEGEVGTQYYRLKIVDKNGVYSYSPVISVQIGQGEFRESAKEVSFRIFPIPTVDFLTLEVTAEEEGDFKAYLVNNYGQNVKIIENRRIRKGVNRIEIEVLDIPEGQYALSFFVNDIQYIGKVIVLDR